MTNTNSNFRIKLIFPGKFEVRKQYFNSSSLIPPYGMGILANFLRKRNYHVEQEDLSARIHHEASPCLSEKGPDLDILNNIDTIKQLLLNGSVDNELDSFIKKILASFSVEGFHLIGFSVISSLHFMLTLHIAKRLKQKTDVPIVFGGPFITLYSHLYPEIFDFADYAIIGEGMIPLLRLIEHYQGKAHISEVPNLAYRAGGGIITNPRQYYPIEDVPVPDFEGLLGGFCSKQTFSDYFRLPYQLTRGCRNRCRFCCTHLCVFMESKSYGKIIRELTLMKKAYNNSKFYFCDDTINNSYRYLDELCAFFIQSKLNIQWSSYARADNLDMHLLRKMSRAGCEFLFFGIESGSDKILKAMNKGFTADQARDTLKKSYKTGIKNIVSFMVGYPHETEEDILATKRFIKANKKYIYGMRIYKFNLEFGSSIYTNPERYGVSNVVKDPVLYWHMFDELNGLTWPEKKRQMDNHEKQVIDLAFTNIKGREFFKRLFSDYYKLFNRK